MAYDRYCENCGTLMKAWEYALCDECATCADMGARSIDRATIVALNAPWVESLNQRDAERLVALAPEESRCICGECFSPWHRCSMSAVAAKGRAHG